MRGQTALETSPSPRNWMFHLTARCETGCLPAKDERHLWTKIEHTKGNLSLSVSVLQYLVCKGRDDLAEALLNTSTLVTHLLRLSGVSSLILPVFSIVLKILNMA